MVSHDTVVTLLGFNQVHTANGHPAGESGAAWWGTKQQRRRPATPHQGRMQSGERAENAVHSLFRALLSGGCHSSPWVGCGADWWLAAPRQQSWRVRRGGIVRTAGIYHWYHWVPQNYCLLHHCPMGPNAIACISQRPEGGHASSSVASPHCPIHPLEESTRTEGCNKLHTVSPPSCQYYTLTFLLDAACQPSEGALPGASDSAAWHPPSAHNNCHYG